MIAKVELAVLMNSCKGKLSRAVISQFLKAHPGSTVGFIAESVKLSHSGVLLHLLALERAGLVYKVEPVERGKPRGNNKPNRWYPN